MGITAFSISLLEKHIDINTKSVIEAGSQNLYLDMGDPLPPFANTWYEERGIEYTCIDLGGDNNAIQKDLAYPVHLGKQFDLVTDFGSAEHVVQMEEFESVAFHEGHINSIYPKGIKSIEQGFYNCWLNKHNFCKTGGLIISENPKMGHWPDHGYSYITTRFYAVLTIMTDYEIVELGEHCAMGNCESGINIYCALRKQSDKFPSFEEFSALPIFKK